MEQVIPGSNPEDDSDLIIEAVEYKNRGDYTRAWDVLGYILKQDLRCIDAHVHMGNFDFGEGLWEFSNKRALKHFTVGVELNPMDNQGVRFLIPELKAKVPYGESRI